MNVGRVLEWFKRAKAFENYKTCDNSGDGIMSHKVIQAKKNMHKILRKRNKMKLARKLKKYKYGLWRNWQHAADLKSAGVIPVSNLCPTNKVNMLLCVYGDVAQLEGGNGFKI